MSQNLTYSTWHDLYKTNEVSIQQVQNKFMSTLNTSTKYLLNII